MIRRQFVIGEPGIKSLLWRNRRAGPAFERLHIMRRVVISVIKIGEQRPRFSVARVKARDGFIRFESALKLRGGFFFFFIRTAEFEQRQRQAREQTMAADALVIELEGFDGFAFGRGDVVAKEKIEFA